MAAEDTPWWTPLLPPSVCVDEEEVARIRLLPQGSPEWKAARKGRTTGSNFGAAVGNSQYTSPSQLVKEMLSPTFTGNAACDYGTRMEPVVRDLYVAHNRGMLADSGADPTTFWVETTGLCINLRWPFLGASPDGLIHDPVRGWGLLEIKAPYSHKYTGTIHPHYYDQCIGNCAILGLAYFDFVTYVSAETVYIQQYTFNVGYWEGFLLPRLTAFYFNLFLPALHSFKCEPSEVGPSQAQCSLLNAHGRNIGGQSGFRFGPLLAENGIVKECSAGTPLPPPIPSSSSSSFRFRNTSDSTVTVAHN